MESQSNFTEKSEVICQNNDSEQSDCDISPSPNSQNNLKLANNMQIYNFGEYMNPIQNPSSFNFQNTAQREHDKNNGIKTQIDFLIQTAIESEAKIDNFNFEDYSYEIEEDSLNLKNEEVKQCETSIIRHSGFNHQYSFGELVIEDLEQSEKEKVYNQLSGYNSKQINESKTLDIDKKLRDNKEDNVPDDFTFGAQSEFSFGNNAEVLAKNNLEDFNFNSTLELEEDIQKVSDSLTLANHINFYQISNHSQFKINFRHLMVVSRVGNYGYSEGFQILDLETNQYYLMKLFKNSQPDNENYFNDEMNFINYLNDIITVSFNTAATEKTFLSSNGNLRNSFKSKVSPEKYEQIFPKFLASGKAEIFSSFLKLFVNLGDIFLEPSQMYLTEGSTNFILMEYGLCTLRSIIDRKKYLRTEKKQTGIWQLHEILEITEALADIIIIYQHENLVCINLKPDNIILTQAKNDYISQIKITGFMNTKNASNLIWNEEFDRDEYVAPELKMVAANPKNTLDMSQSDLYSLGLIMKELFKELEPELILKYKNYTSILEETITQITQEKCDSRNTIQNLKNIISIIRLDYQSYRLTEVGNEEDLSEEEKMMNSSNQKISVVSKSKSIDSYKYISKLARVAEGYPNCWDILSEDLLKYKIDTSIKSKIVFCEIYCNSMKILSKNDNIVPNTENYLFCEEDIEKFIKKLRDHLKLSPFLIECIKSLLKSSNDRNFDEIFIANLFKTYVTKSQLIKLFEMYGISLYLKYIPLIEQFILSSLINISNKNTKDTETGVSNFDLGFWLMIYGYLLQTKNKQFMELEELLLVWNLLAEHYKSGMTSIPPTQSQIRDPKFDKELFEKLITTNKNTDLCYIEKMIQIFLNLHLQIILNKPKEAEKYLFDLLALPLNEYTIVLLDFFLKRWSQNNENGKILAGIEPVFHYFIKSNNIIIYKTTDMWSNIIWMFCVASITFAHSPQIKNIEEFIIKLLAKIKQEKDILMSYSSFVNHIYDVYAFQCFFYSLVPNHIQIRKKQYEEEQKIIFVLTNPKYVINNVLNDVLVKDILSRKSNHLIEKRNLIIRRFVEMSYATNISTHKSIESSFGYLTKPLLNDIKNLIVTQQFYEAITVLKWVYRFNFSHCMNHPFSKPENLQNIVDITHDDNNLVPSSKPAEFLFWTFLIILTLTPLTSPLSYAEDYVKIIKQTSEMWINEFDEDTKDNELINTMINEANSRIDIIYNVIKKDLYHLLKFGRNSYESKCYMNIDDILENFNHQILQQKTNKLELS